MQPSLAHRPLRDRKQHKHLIGLTVTPVALVPLLGSRLPSLDNSVCQSEVLRAPAGDDIVTQCFGLKAKSPGSLFNKCCLRH